MAQDKGQLRDLLTSIATAETRIGDFMRPLNDALSELGGLRDQLQEVFSVEVVGNCEGCDTLIVTGDRGHVCAGGELLCEVCAPSYRDLKAQFEARLQSADPDDVIEAKNGIIRIDQLVAGGASIDAKAVDLFQPERTVDDTRIADDREGRVVADRPQALEDAAQIVRCLARGRQLNGDVDTAQALQTAANAILEAKDKPIDWSKFATVIGEPVIHK